MAAVPNSLLSGVPSVLSFTPTSGVAIEFGDPTACTFSDTATSFDNAAGDRLRPLNGGTTRIDETGSFTVLDADIVTAGYASLRAGQTGTLTTTFNKRGATAANSVQSTSGSCTIRIDSKESGDVEGRQSWTFNFTMFSNDGATDPLTWA